MKKIDATKLLILFNQVFFLLLGYITQILLSKYFLSAEQFGYFQFSNFLTNILYLFFANPVATLFSKELAEHPANGSDNSYLKSMMLSMLFWVCIQLIASALVLAICFGVSIISSSILLIALVSTIQLITYSILNMAFYFYIGKRKIKTFSIYYLFFIVIKAVSIIILAAYSKSALLVVIGIIISHLLVIGFVLITNYKNLTSILFAKVMLSKIRKTPAEIKGIFLSNFLLFIFINLGVLISFLNLTSNYQDFAIYTMVQPWVLLSLYLISSLGNLYVVDFASGRLNLKSINKTLINVVLLSIAVNLLSLIVGGAFFYIVYNESFYQAIRLLILSFPLGIFISILSILISILTGLGQLDKLARWVVGIVIIYLLLTFIFPSIEMVILITTFIYLLIIFLVYIFINKK